MIAVFKKIMSRFAFMIDRIVLSLLITFQTTKIYPYHRYQPLPWINLKSKKRQQSTIKRWEAISLDLPKKAKSALDIGSNLGYFVLKFAESREIAIGVDGQKENIFLANLVARKAGISGAMFSEYMVEPNNINSLPSVDVTIFLSTWHHWIRYYGAENADLMLQALWEKTNLVMYFESGEDSEIDELGVAVDPKSWLVDKLTQLLQGSEITELGQFDSGSHKAEDFRTQRSLFSVKKII